MAQTLSQSASALVIPLPGAAIARVIQARTRGRLPRAVAYLPEVRRHLRDAQRSSQTIAQNNRRIQLQAACDRAMNEFCDLNRELTSLNGQGA